MDCVPTATVDADTLPLAVGWSSLQRGGTAGEQLHRDNRHVCISERLLSARLSTNHGILIQW